MSNCPYCRFILFVCILVAQFIVGLARLNNSSVFVHYQFDPGSSIKHIYQKSDQVLTLLRILSNNNRRPIEFYERTYSIEPLENRVSMRHKMCAV